MKPSFRRLKVCRETWYYLIVLGVVLSGAFLREVNLLFVFAGMLTGPLLLNWRTVSSSLAKLKVRRKLPNGICAGDPLVGHIELTNSRRKFGSWAVTVTDSLQCNGSETIKPETFFPFIGGRQTEEGSYQCRLTQRGRYEVGPFSLTTRFPFGLFERTMVLGEKESLVVFPRLGNLSQRWLARHQESFEGNAQAKQKHHRVEGEFYGVRDWRDGDSQRSIHWRSSARRGSWVVRQFEQPHNRDVAVLIDLMVPATKNKKNHEPNEALETAISFAATAVANLCRQGGANILIGTTATPDEPIIGPASLALLQDVMNELAVIEPHTDDRLSRLLEQTVAKLGTQTDVILVSTTEINLDDPERFEKWHGNPARRL
ncbi:MAG: DUF58 domain-containing protein, partial [Planctomycetia bacterium]